jgi:flagellar protein FlaF
MAATNPLKAYEDTVKATLSGRDLEAHVLNRAAQLLVQCQNHWNESGHEERLNEALNFNQKLWLFFQIELATPEHPLPKKIREDMLSLSVFIDKTIFDVMADPAFEKLTSIININHNIAAGLSVSSGNQG